MKRYSFRLEDPFEEAFRSILRRELGRMVRSEKAVTAGYDMEALHRMRVSCRRLRAACGIFRSRLRKPVREFTAFVGRTGKALGRLRDLQLLDKDLRDFAAPGPDDLFRKLDGLLGEERARLAGYLADPGYGREKERYLALFSGGMSRWFRNDRGRSGILKLRYVFPGLILQCYQDMLAFQDLRDEAVVSPEVYHVLRIRTKTFRYAMEFANSAAGGVFRPLLRPVVRLQDLLGSLQDALTAGDRLRGLLERDPDGVFRTSPVSAYLTETRHRGRKFSAGVPPVYGRITNGVYSRKLLEILFTLMPDFV